MRSLARSCWRHLPSPPKGHTAAEHRPENGTVCGSLPAGPETEEKLPRDQDGNTPGASAPAAALNPGFPIPGSRQQPPAGELRPRTGARNGRGCGVARSGPLKRGLRAGFSAGDPLPDRARPASHGLRWGLQVYLSSTAIASDASATMSSTTPSLSSSENKLSRDFSRIRK